MARPGGSSPAGTAFFEGPGCLSGGREGALAPAVSVPPALCRGRRWTYKPEFTTQITRLQPGSASQGTGLQASVRVPVTLIARFYG